MFRSQSSLVCGLQDTRDLKEWSHINQKLCHVVFDGHDNKLLRDSLIFRFLSNDILNVCE